jgi:hypothetical protein
MQSGVSDGTEISEGSTALASTLRPHLKRRLLTVSCTSFTNHYDLFLSHTRVLSVVV